MDKNNFDQLIDIVKRLRKECPWDKEQTNDSIKAATLEEAYELLEAIDNKDYKEIKSELGDLLFHIVFHSVMAEENKLFNLDEVINGIKEKLIRRHPHVFGNTEVSDSEDVKRNWEEIKLSEGRDSVLEGVPTRLPSLQKAHRLQEKAAKVGFDWEKKEDVWKKVIEEINEMHEAEQEKREMGNGKWKMEDGKSNRELKIQNEKYKRLNIDEDELNSKLESEIGDVFFALVNYARFLGINPENALRRTNEKFINRFKFVENKIAETGRKVTESNLAEMDKYWEESKKLFN